jgi:DNA replication protein DnaC
MLAAAVADGRLTPDEHAERTEAALYARTLGDLAELTADLAPAAQQPIQLDDTKGSAARPRAGGRSSGGYGIGRYGAGHPGPAIEEAARVLHLPAVRDVYEEAAAEALRERSTYKEYLAAVLGAEVARRRQRMVREARFPRAKRIEDFDFDANPDVAPEQVATLCTPAWVSAGQSLCLLGASGTGKSHLLIGIGTAIAEAGLKVRYATTANLVTELAEAANHKQLTKLLTRYRHCDLLCLDDFGYTELDPAGTRLLFQVLTDREERRAVAVASATALSAWQRFFAVPELGAAIVDRFAGSAHVIETGRTSYRPTQRASNADDQVHVTAVEHTWIPS